MQGIYTYIPETNCIPRDYNVAAILLLLFIVFIIIIIIIIIIMWLTLKKNEYLLRHDKFYHISINQYAKG